MRDARDLEQRYRELERRKEVTLAVKVRRGQVGLLLALLVSVLLASVTAAVDLRRLQTPAGAAQAWAEATVFGDCGRHLSLSLPEVEDDDERGRLCALVDESSAFQVASTTRVRTTVGLVQGRRAVVQAVLERPDGTVETRLRLVKRGDDWKVVRDAPACRLGCAVPQPG